jgi:hypothetical protein
MKPIIGEFNPYFEKYILKVGDENVITAMHKQVKELDTFLRSIPAEKLDYRYADGKWTIKQVLQHIIDTERIMAYRALTIARRDTVSLPGFDENTYADAAPATENSWEDMLLEFQALRFSHIFMFGNMSNEDMACVGTSSNHAMSVTALAHIIVGHVEHHVTVLKERYL